MTTATPPAQPTRAVCTQCLPATAITYYHSLCAAEFADASSALAITEKRFLQEESAHGRNIGGAGFATRLGKIYVNELDHRTHIIVSTLKLVHSDFGAPLAMEVDAQLQELGLNSLSEQLQGLDGGYQRYLSRLGIPSRYPSGLSQRYPLHHVTVSNQISHYLWVLRNVPMKSPVQPIIPSTLIFNGPVGAVQTGPNATAHVQQHLMHDDLAHLADALHQLRSAIRSAPELDLKGKDGLVAEINMAEAELRVENPRSDKLLGWLCGIATAVQTIGSAQAALEAVRTAAKAIGLPL